MRIVVIGVELPGRAYCTPSGEPLHDVQVGLQVGRDPCDLVPGDAAEARWELDVRTLDESGELDFRGPAVQGRNGERFLYLTWGNVGEDGGFEMFRRAKLMLNRIDPDLVRSAVQHDRPLVATVRLTDERGGPRCARVDPPAITWTVPDSVGREHPGG